MCVCVRLFDVCVFVCFACLLDGLCLLVGLFVCVIGVSFVCSID